MFYIENPVSICSLIVITLFHILYRITHYEFKLHVRVRVIIDLQTIS